MRYSGGLISMADRSPGFLTGGEMRCPIPMHLINILMLYLILFIPIRSDLHSDWINTSNKKTGDKSKNKQGRGISCPRNDRDIEKRAGQ